MNFKASLQVAALAAVVAMAGCATSSPDVVSRSGAQQLQSVRLATVESVRAVTIDGSQSGIGAVAGGVTGAIAGSSLRGHNDAIIGGVLVGLAGAVVGNAIERAATHEDGVELVLVFSDGTRQALVQARGAETFFPGDHVEVVGTPSHYRISRTR